MCLLIYIHTYNIIYKAPFKQEYTKQSAERRKKEGRERKEANRLLWEQVGFDQLFERGYGGKGTPLVIAGSLFHR